MTEIKTINVAKIRTGENEQRLKYDDEALQNLASSIRRVGLISPISVASRGDYYVVVAGHRRLAACRSLGMVDIPCVEVVQEDGSAREVTFAENFFREDLTPIEQAHAIADVLSGGEITESEVAAMMHKTIEWVRRQVAITTWPDDVQAIVHERLLSVSAASNIALIPDQTYRQFLLKQAAENGATARATAAWLQAYQAMTPPEQAVEAEPLPPSAPAEPLTPQSPCFFCTQVLPVNRMSHVPICSSCVETVRQSLQSAG